METIIKLIQGENAFILPEGLQILLPQGLGLTEGQTINLEVTKDKEVN